ncbi:Protein BPS1 chloroplastic [Bienertia sinuspersici]
MVVLIKKSSKFRRKSNPKLDHSESIAQKSFQSYLSESLHRLLADQKHGSNSLSLSWFIPCFKFLQGMNRAFAKLVKDLNYPISKWKGNFAEEYLSYTLNMLDALNSISSSISHVGISRLTLTHAISLISNSPSSAIQHLKPIIPRKVKVENPKNKGVGSFNCDEEKVIHEAMMKMKGINLLILRVLVSGLSEVNGDLSWLNSAELEGFDLNFSDSLVVKEIEEVNEAVKRIKDGLVEEQLSSKNELVAEELKKKLGEIENLMEMVNKEVNCLFSEVLARRSELIDCLRLPKSSS